MTLIENATFESRIRDWCRRQRVCITGGHGSLGSRLGRLLTSYGVSSLIVFDRKSVGFHDAGSLPSVSHIRGSITNASDLLYALLGCTAVFHLAAMIHVGQSMKEPASCFKVNGLGTVNVLDACRKQGVKQVIYASTSYVYGAPQQIPISEDHPVRPLSVYAASKLAGEVMIQGYSENFGLSCDIARFSNIYGGALDADTAVNAALAQAAAGGPIALRNLSAVRDFVHVDDVVDALVRLAVTSETLSGCRVMNVSSGHGTSIGDLARTIGEIARGLGLGMPEVIQTGDPRNETVSTVILDNRRLMAATGWTARVSLEEGLRRSLMTLQKQKQTEK
jgi:nucleoside-diphosphate-sugar epimerase